MPLSCRRALPTPPHTRRAITVCAPRLARSAARLTLWCVCVIRRSPQAHSQQVVKARLNVVFLPGHLQGGPSRRAASPHFCTQNEPPERCSKFSSAARGSQCGACGAGNLFDGEARAQKWLEKCAGAESTRLVALVHKIKVRCANTAGNTGAAGCR